MFNPDSLWRYFYNTSWLLAERVFRILSILFLTVWLARYLGPEKFGVLNYIQSFIGIFVLFTNLGLDNLLVRDLVRSAYKENVLLGTAFIMRCISIIIILVLLYLCNVYIGNDDYISLLIFIMAIGYLLQPCAIIEYYYQAKVNSKNTVIAYFIPTVFLLIALTFLILINADLKYIVIAFTLYNVFIGLLLLIIYTKNNQSILSWQFNKFIAIGYIKEGWPLIISAAMVSIYINIDKIMIQEILGAVETGQYSAAAKLSEGWYFIPTIIVSSLFPAIINAKQTSEKHYYKRLQNLYDLMVWLGLFVAIIISMLANDIIILLYGDTYSRASDVLVIHIWSGIFVFLGVASGKWMILEGYTKQYLYRTISGVILNVIANIVFIPMYGINGAAIATLIASIYVAIVFDVFSLKTLTSFKMKCRALFPIHLIRQIKLY